MELMCKTSEGRTSSIMAKKYMWARGITNPENMSKTQNIL